MIASVIAPMIAIDTSALVAILQREEEADDFLHIIVHAEKRVLSAVSFLETSIVLAARHGTPSTWQPLDALLSAAALELVPYDATQAALSRQAFVRFGKGRHPAALNICDCASYALAKSRDIPLLYKGQDFAKTDLAPAH